METELNEEILEQVMDIVFDEEYEVTDKTEEDQETQEQTYGCEHYKRKCKLITPCCNKLYYCRFCHDEDIDIRSLETIHEIDREGIEHVRCIECDYEQTVRQDCENCGIRFGEYFCEKCKLYDDEDKGQYHCEKCGICRVGGEENNYHCDGCGMCKSREVKEKHDCINMMDDMCPICMEELFISRDSITKLKCGHSMHIKCMYELLKTDYKCPLCLKSIVDLTNYNSLMDKEVAETKMPEELKNQKVKILCNECYSRSEINFHIVGSKCPECGTYNTRNI